MWHPLYTWTNNPEVHPVIVTETLSGGYEYAKRSGRRRTKEEINEERVKFGLTEFEAKIVEKVAVEQTEHLNIAEKQRIKELKNELKISGLKYQNQYLKYLNYERQRLINEEIGNVLKLKQEEESIFMLLMITI
jgi:hypothetical protein